MSRRNPRSPFSSLIKKGWGIMLYLLLLFTACSTDSYETGDGEYSYLRAEFVVAHTDKETKFDYVTTDNDNRIYLSPKVETAWAKTPDSLYRAVIYYNNVEDLPSEIYPSEVSDATLAQVLTLIPKQREQLKEVTTDPLIFESAWISRNGKFLNIGFAIKTGQKDGNSVTQTIGVCIDNILTDDNGNKTVCMQIIHNQNGAPEYYSSHGFASIPIENEYRDATLRISIPTYNGTVVKEFCLTSK